MNKPDNGNTAARKTPGFLSRWSQAKQQVADQRGSERPGSEHPGSEHPGSELRGPEQQEVKAPHEKPLPDDALQAQQSDRETHTADLDIAPQEPLVAEPAHPAEHLSQRLDSLLRAGETPPDSVAARLSAFTAGVGEAQPSTGRMITEVATHESADVVEGPAAGEEVLLTDADMPDVETLDASSDFSGFFNEGVSKELRQKALRKLFFNPKFNIRDGLNDYDEDYTYFEPLGDTVTCDMKFHIARKERERLERERLELEERQLLEQQAEQEQDAQPQNEQDEQQQEELVAEELQNDTELAEDAEPALDAAAEAAPDEPRAETADEMTKALSAPDPKPLASVDSDNSHDDKILAEVPPA